MILTFGTSYAQPQIPTEGITVVGYALQQPPQTNRKITFSINKRAATRESAVAYTDSIAKLATERLVKKYMIPRDSIKRISVNAGEIYPVTKESNNWNIIAQYTVSSNKLTLQELNAELTPIGVSAVMPSFSMPAMSTEVKNKLRDLALADARTKAETLARSLGVKLGVPLQVIDDDASIVSSASYTRELNAVRGFDMAQPFSYAIRITYKIEK